MQLMQRWLMPLALAVLSVFVPAVADADEGVAVGPREDAAASGVGVVTREDTAASGVGVESRDDSGVIWISLPTEPPVEPGRFLETKFSHMGRNSVYTESVVEQALHTLSVVAGSYDLGVVSQAVQQTNVTQRVVFDYLQAWKRRLYPGYELMLQIRHDNTAPLTRYGLGDPESYKGLRYLLGLRCKF